jgi:hypothetical protein
MKTYKFYHLDSLLKTTIEGSILLCLLYREQMFALPNIPLGVSLYNRRVCNEHNVLCYENMLSTLTSFSS